MCVCVCVCVGWRWWTDLAAVGSGASEEELAERDFQFSIALLLFRGDEAVGAS